MNTNRSGMGGHAPHGQHNASHARFVACPGKAEGRKEAERPPALQSVGDPAVLLSASYPCARQPAIHRSQSHVFETWGVAGVLVFGLRVCASIAVCVAV